MPITYGGLIEEVDGLTHMYGVNPESDDDGDDSYEAFIEQEIRDYHNNVMGIIFEKTAEQIHGKNLEIDIDEIDIDKKTIVSQETITSISDTLDEKNFSDDMIIAFRYFLNESAADIFDLIVEIFDEHGNQDICEQIASNGLLDKVKTDPFLVKLYNYCDQGKEFIEAIGLLLVKKGVRLDDFRKTGELDIEEEIKSFRLDIQRLIMAKVGCTQISTMVH